MKNCLVVILLVLISIVGCKKLDKLTQFNMEYNTSLVVPSTIGINIPVSLVTPDIKSNSESTFAVNDTRKDLVEEITLTKLNLTITSPSNVDFSFLKSIEVFIVADGLSEQKIAWKENVPSNIGRFLEIETSCVNIKEYIKKDKFTLRLSTITDEIITSDYHIDIHSVFFVDAKILGQ